MGFHRDLVDRDLHAPSNEKVENNSGSTINKMIAVQFNGMGTNFMQIIPGDGSSNVIRGVTQRAISNVVDINVGFITALGILTDVDTSAFAVNDFLYAGPSGVLQTAVNGPIIAQVLVVDALHGKIYVQIPVAGTDLDVRVKVAATDTTTGFLKDKLVSGTGISITEQNIGGNETLLVAASGAALTDEKVKVSATDTTSDYLNNELTTSVGTNSTLALEKSITSPGGNEKLNIQFDQTKISISSAQVTDFTEASQDATASLIQNGTGISWVYNDPLNILTPTISLSPFSTTNLAEGTNLYYTDTRARAAISVSDTASIDFTYTPSTGVITGSVLPGGVDHNALLNWVANKHIDHSTVSLVAGTGISSTGLGDITASRTINLANTTVTASSYGSSAQVPTFTVNAQGQLTAAANVAISLTSTSITDFTEAAQDAIGGAWLDTSSIDFTYNDAGNSMSAVVLPGGVDHNALLNWVANKHIDHSTVSLIAGTGISSTGLGDITASRTINLANTAVTAGSYGSATQSPTYTVNAQGQLTLAANVTITPAWSSITTTPTTLSGYGITDAVKNQLGTPSVTSDLFTNRPAFGTVGRIFIATDTNIIYRDTGAAWVVLSPSSGGTVTSITAGTGLSGGTITSSGTIALANTAVTAASYGSATQVPTYTVNAQGQLTAAANVAIQITESQVTNLTTDLAGKVPTTRTITAGTGLTGGGDLSADRTLAIANTAVTASSYGSATQVATFTVNAQGQLTAASNVAIAITSSGVTDFTEAAQDAIAAALTNTSSISFTYNDPANQISAAVLPGGVDHNALLNWVANKHIDHSTVSLIAGTGISSTGLGDITASRTINLANTAVTAGSYGSSTQSPTYTVNAQGQLTLAANVTITPAWSSITATPTTLSGYGITDAVKNQLGTPSITSDLFANRPAFGTAGRIFISTDTNTIYRDTGTSWVIIGNSATGTVTSITAGTGLSGGTITSSGTIALANTAVTAGSYGSATQIPTHTVNAQGQLTAAANVAIQITESQVTNLTTDLAGKVPTTRTITAGTGLTGGGDLSADRTISLANTSVTASSYGSSTQVATFTVNAQGQLTAAANVAISITSSGVSDFTEAVQDVIGGTWLDTSSIDFTYNDAGNSMSAVVLPGGVDHNALLNWVANKHIDHSTVSLIAGTGISSTGLGDITTSRTINLANTAVTAGTYGSSTLVPVFTVNAQGQLTAASSVSISGTNYWFVDFTLDPGGLLTWQDQTGQDLCIRQAGSSGSPYIRQVASNGTLAAPTATTSGQRLGGNGYYGWNTASTTGVDPLPSVAFNGYATENHTSTAQGGELRIELIPNGSVTPVTTATFENTGDLDITGAISIGNTTDTTDGYIRYTGSEFQGRQAGAWVPFAQVPTYLSATATVTTTSATFATVGSMTSTPAAGTYKLEFTCASSFSASTGTGDFSVFIGGVEQTQCRRTCTGLTTGAIATPISIITRVTVNGSQVLDIQFRRNTGGTLTVTNREYLLTPISR